MGKIIFQALLSFVFVLLLLFPNLFASWGLIDDHEIIRNLGPDEQMGFSEIPYKLTQTEVFFANEGLTRYRPAYWIANLLETATWGAKAENWYRFRLFLIVTSIFISWYLLSKNLGLALSGIACLYLFTAPYWADTWARLGPAELYAFFGLALYCLAFYKLWTYDVSAKWWVLLALGAFLAFGSKENFLFLLPATAPLLYRIWKNKKLTLLPITCSAFILVTGVFIAVTVLILLSRTGTDIYGNSVDPTARFLSKLFTKPNQIAIIPVLISATLLGVATILKKNISTFKRLFFIESLLLAVWISQFFFYDGGLPFENRYDFPGLFVRDLAFFFLIYAPLTLLATSDFKFKGWVRTGALITLIIGTWYFYAWKGFIHIQTASAENLKKTHAFLKAVSQMITTLRSYPDVPIILHAHTVGDVEPLMSFSRYISIYGVTNPMAVFFEEKVIDNYTREIEWILFDKLKKLSETGYTSKIGRQFNFSPLSSITTDRCFAVGFSGTSDLNCLDLGRIW